MRSVLPDNVGPIMSAIWQPLGGAARSGRGKQRSGEHLCASRLEPDELPDKRSGQRVKVAGQVVGSPVGDRQTTVWQHATMNFAYVTGRERRLKQRRRFV